VLVAALGAQNAEPLQASTQIGSGLAVPVRQRESQFAIGKTQFEVADHLRVCEAAAFEIAQCFGRVPQRLVIEAHHIAQGLLIVGVGRDRRCEFHRCAFANHVGATGG